MSDAQNDVVIDETLPATEAATPETPQVEIREGKMFIDGVRVYTRDDTNRIAANAKKEAESKILTDLSVDSFDQIKTVISQLRDGEANGSSDLSVASLRDAISKKEATVEELKAELNKLRTEGVLKEHVNELKSAMPRDWSREQQQAVLDLMKGRDMLVIENDQFYIRSGDQFITDASGEKPDYNQAIQLMARTLGLNMGKNGVKLYEGSDGSATESRATHAVDDSRLATDPAYRSAYVQVREKNRSLARSQITDAMVTKHMEAVKPGSAAQKMLTNTAKTTNAKRKG